MITVIAETLHEIAKVDWCEPVYPALSVRLVELVSGGAVKGNHLVQVYFEWANEGRSLKPIGEMTIQDFLANLAMARDLAA